MEAITKNSILCHHSTEIVITFNVLNVDKIII